MKILAISDVESRYLWDDFSKEKLKEIDLILSCGDLSPLYLSFLATFFQGPVLYVHGNHDAVYQSSPLTAVSASRIKSTSTRESAFWDWGDPCGIRKAPTNTRKPR